MGPGVRVNRDSLILLSHPTGIVLGKLNSSQMALVSSPDVYTHAKVRLGTLGKVRVPNQKFTDLFRNLCVPMTRCQKYLAARLPMRDYNVPCIHVAQF